MNKTIFAIGAVCLMLYACSPSKSDEAYNKAYSACTSKWMANDTMKNTALLSVQMIFYKHDQSSVVAKWTYLDAISFLCKADAQEAAKGVK